MFFWWWPWSVWVQMKTINMVCLLALSDQSRLVVYILTPHLPDPPSNGVERIFCWEFYGINFDESPASWNYTEKFRLIWERRQEQTGYFDSRKITYWSFRDVVKRGLLRGLQTTRPHHKTDILRLECDQVVNKFAPIFHRRAVSRLSSEKKFSLSGLDFASVGYVSRCNDGFERNQITIGESEDKLVVTAERHWLSCSVESLLSHN